VQSLWRRSRSQEKKRLERAPINRRSASVGLITPTAKEGEKKGAYCVRGGKVLGIVFLGVSAVSKLTNFRKKGEELSDRRPAEESPTTDD